MKYLKYKNLFIIALSMFYMSCNTSGSNELNYNFFENNKWGVIANDGKIIMENDFKGDLSLYNNGYVIQKKNNGKTYLVNSKGIESTNSYMDATFFNSNIAFAVKKNGYPIAIDNEGEEIKELKVDQVFSFINGMALIKSEGKYGFINTNLDVIVEPKFDYSSFYSNEGFVIVNNIDGKQKVLNKKGKEIIIPKKIDRVIHFKDDYFVYVDEESSYGIMDINGNKIIRPNSDWKYLTNFREGLASYLEDGLWGAINKEGVKVIRAKYKHPLIFNEGLAAAFIDKGDKTKVGYIDKSGEYVIEPEYDWASIFINGKSIVKDGKYYYFIDNKNQKSKEDYKKISLNKLQLYLYENNFLDYLRIFKRSLPDSDMVSYSFLSVNSDFYDIDGTVSNLIEKLNIENNSILGGIDSQTLPSSKLLKSNKIYFKDPSYFSEYNYRPTWKKTSERIFNFSDDCNSEITIRYSNNIYSTKTKTKETYNYYQRKYIQKEIFDHVEYNDSTNVSNIQVKVILKNKAKSKRKYILESLKRQFNERFSVVDIPYVQDIGSEKYFEISKNIYAQINEEYRNKSIYIKFYFDLKIPVKNAS